MRPFKNKLNQAEAEALAIYVRDFAAAAPAVAIVAPRTESSTEATPTPKPATASAPPPVTQPVPGKQATTTAPTAAPATVSETSDRITQAATGYRQYCLVCHGTDGRGAAVRAGMPTIPDFTDASWQSSRTDARLAVSILEGYRKLMPPFRDQLTRPQAQALTAYVRAFGPQKKPGEGPIATGDLDERMRQLQDQWRELERQIKSLPR